MILLVLACMPKIERGITAAERDAVAPAWVEQAAAGENVYLQAVVAAGSAYDPTGQEGLAALTAQAMVDAGAGERTAQELREALYPTANQFEVVVDREFVSFRLRCLTEHAVLCAGAFVDVLTAPAFRPADVQRLRDELARGVTEELEEDAEAFGETALYSTLYEAHPYGHPVNGRAGSLATLDADTLRDFHTRAYVRRSLTLGIAGPLPADARALLEKGLAGLPTTTPPEVIRPVPVQPKGRELVILDTETATTGFHLAHPTTLDRNHPDWPAMTLGMAAFGLHREGSGRLMRSLRADRGLNYGTYAYAEPYKQRAHGRLGENGVLQVQNHWMLWIRPTSIENGPFALKLAIDELELLVADGITSDEFEQVKARLSKSAPLNALSPGRRLSYALDAAVTGTPDVLDFIPAAFEVITLDQVNAALARHLQPDDLFIVAVTGEALETRLREDSATPIVYADVEAGPEQVARDAAVAAKALGLSQVYRQPAAGLFR